MAENERWPTLPYADWKEALETLHLWTQIVGKVRLELTPQSITGGMYRYTLAHVV